MELFLACAASNLRELEIDQHIYLTTNSCKRIYYIVSTPSTIKMILTLVLEHNDEIVNHLSKV